MPVSQVPFAGISNPVDFRNIVINGDMQIAQRNTSVASITTSSYNTVDRFRTAVDSLGTWTNSQSTDVPSGYGFANSFKLDCTTADASPAAGDLLQIVQRFEGQNLQYLKKGTANASPLTASFWVKSTKTGTFIVELFDNDNSRQISKSYTVSVSNTWEFKTVTFAGDTTGVLDNDNSPSLQLNFWLGAGSTYTSGTLNTSWASSTNANRAVGQVNIADSTANDFLITGVQLEAGEQASGFEFMPIDVNLSRCQRYYYRHVNGNNNMVGAAAYTENTRVDVAVFFPFEMRVAPTLVQSTGTNYYYATYNTAADYFDAFTGVTSATKNGTFLYVTSGVSGAANSGTTCTSSNASASIAFDSEL